MRRLILLMIGLALIGGCIQYSDEDEKIYKDANIKVESGFANLEKLIPAIKARAPELMRLVDAIKEKRFTEIPLIIKEVGPGLTRDGKVMFADILSAYNDIKEGTLVIVDVNRRSEAPWYKGVGRFVGDNLAWLVPLGISIATGGKLVVDRRALSRSREETRVLSRAGANTEGFGGKVRAELDNSRLTRDDMRIVKAEAKRSA